MVNINGHIYPNDDALISIFNNSLISSKSKGEQTKKSTKPNPNKCAMMLEF